ncbi:MAG: DsbA family protein [Campylobacterota bacterium]|nr:DsbA family protein [Campylobacterota bacterium]
MSLMLKLLMSMIVITATLDASMSEAKLTKYVKKFIVKNPAVRVSSVEIVDIQKVDGEEGWEVYLTNMKLIHNGKDLSVPQTIFVNGDLITPALMNLKRNKNYSNEYKPSIPDSYYSDDHLLFGNKDAKHKIVIFSDPQCPYCMEIVPEIMDAARKYPDTFALYYYHLPLLSIHPVSGILVRVMHVAQDWKKSDVVEKLYSLKINPNETNIDKVLAAVKTQTGFSVTKAEIERKAVKQAIESDEDAAAKVMVTGTPTIYFDSQWDKMRNRYKSFMP